MKIYRILNTWIFWAHLPPEHGCLRKFGSSLRGWRQYRVKCQQPTSRLKGHATCNLLVTIAS